jgi:hypothetical protein
LKDQARAREAMGERPVQIEPDPSSAELDRYVIGTTGLPDLDQTNVTRQWRHGLFL